MSSLLKKHPRKLIILGLAESGKSTIINGVIKGIKPQLGGKYDATINYQRIAKDLCDYELLILDLGGQTRFLDQFTGDLAEFVFSNVDEGAFIFVIEPLKVAEFSRAKYYFETSLQKLDYYSPNSLKYIFLNKMDLVPPEKSKKTIELIKKYLTSGLTQEIRFYETSVYSESVFVAMGDVLAEITGIRNRLNPILVEFIQQNESIVNQVQILTKEGAVLVIAKNKKDLINISLKETRKIFSSSQKKMDEKIVINEFNRVKLSITNFMDNGLALMVLMSKKGIKNNDQLSTTVYDQVLSLSNQIDLYMK